MHRTKNRAPNMLRRKARRSRDDEPEVQDDEDDEQPVPSGNDEAEGDVEGASGDDAASRSRARRHSKRPFNPRSDDPSQTSFYPGTWQEVLSAAKMHWRVRVATEWGFPKLRERNADILSCLTQAIAEYENNNGSLEEGTSYRSHYRFSILKRSIL